MSVSLSHFFPAGKSSMGPMTHGRKDIVPWDEIPGGEMELGNKEKDWMKEGVWLKEEETMEMIESLMQTDAHFVVEIVNQEKTTTTPMLNRDDIVQIVESLDNENNIVNTYKAIQEDNTNGSKVLPLLDKGWEMDSVVVDEGDNIWKCLWNCEDDKKMWEFDSYPIEVDQLFE